MRIVGTVTNLSRPYQEILIVSSARLQLSGQTRQDGHLATDQTRRPPVASSHAKTHGQLKELHIPSWATARPCLRPLTSLCILGSELVVHHFCQLEVDALPLGMPAINNVARQTRLSWLCLPCELWLTPHRSASLASDAYVTRAIPAREATKPQELHAPQNRIRRYRLATFSAGRDFVTKSPRKVHTTSAHTIDPLSSVTSPLGKTKKDKEQKKSFRNIALTSIPNEPGSKFNPPLTGV